jgi:hypothetical protein
MAFRAVRGELEPISAQRLGFSRGGVMIAPAAVGCKQLLGRSRDPGCSSGGCTVTQPPKARNEL